MSLSKPVKFDWNYKHTSLTELIADKAQDLTQEDLGASTAYLKKFIKCFMKQALGVEGAYCSWQLPM